MKIIHLTDLHLVAPGAMLWGLDPLARLDVALADIAAHHPDAAFCAITGDLAERGETEAYAALRDRLGRFPLETHLIPGNHDDRRKLLAVLGGDDGTGHVQKAIERDGRHFLFLDTLKGPPSSGGRYDAPRRDWLARKLAEARGAPVYLFMHHPPFDIGHPLMDLIKLDDAEAFSSLLADHDVRHMFFGHSHSPISG